jgi:hypothetical protein
MSKKNKVIFFRVEEKHYDELAQLSARQHQTISEIARAAVSSSLRSSQSQRNLLIDQLSALISQLKYLVDSLTGGKESESASCDNSRIGKNLN